MVILGPAFDLEHADRIGLTQHVVDRGILGRHRGQGECAPVVVGDKVEGLADAGQHAEPEDVDLEDAESVDIVLVPFDHGAIDHRRIGDRHDLGERPAGDDKAADVLRQMARKPDQLVR